MLELPHAAVGAAIAIAIPNPAISIPLALASHFAMDLFPHWNPHIGRELKRYGHFTLQTTTLLLLDSGLALTMGFYLANRSLSHPTQALNILLCCFAAVLPDVIEIPTFLFHQNWRWLNKFSKFESSYQSRLSAPAGVYTQIFVLIVCFFIIAKNLVP